MIMPIFKLIQPRPSCKKTSYAGDPSSISKRFHQDESGIAALEFALIAPVMVMMYFGMAEIASAISVDRSISHGTNVAGDLATQEPSLEDEDIEEALAAALRVMQVDDVSKISLDMESFILVDGETDPVSRGRIQLNNSGGKLSRFDASGLGSKLLNENSGVVVTRVSYTYTPLKLRYFNTDITLEESFRLKPRRSDAVDLVYNSSTDITCTATSYANVSCS